MNKKLKISLIQTSAGIVCMGLAVPSKSLVLLGVACVLVWIGARGLIDYFRGKVGVDK